MEREAREKVSFSLLLPVRLSLLYPSPPTSSSLQPPPFPRCQTKNVSKQVIVIQIVVFFRSFSFLTR